MKTWRIPITWSVCGFVSIDADTLAEAMDIAHDDENVLPLPSEAQYVDGSWELSHTDVEEVRQCYNHNQSDDK